MKTVTEQIQELYPDFADEVVRLDTEALKGRIVSLQQQLEESEVHKEANEALKDARNTVNELMGPYRDVRKAVKLKTKYLVELLSEKVND